MSSNGLLVQPDESNILDKTELHRQLMQLIGRDLGLSDYGSAVNHTSFNSNTEFAHRVQNQGTGGHLDVPGLFSVTNGGTSVTALAASSLAVSGNATVGGTLGVTGVTTLSSVTASGAAVFNGNVTLGDAAGDTITVNGTPTFATAVTFANNLTVQGALAVDGNTTLGNAIGDTVTIAGPATVGGTLGVTGVSTLGVLAAGATTVTTLVASSTLQVQGAASFDGAVTLGNASGDAITVTGTATFAQTPVFSAQIDVQGGTAGSVRAGAVIVNAASLDGSEELLVNGQSKLKGDVTITTGTFRHESGGVGRIEANSTGLGFFNSTPIAKPTVTGSRGGNAALQDLLSELANLGLIIDLSS